MFEGSFHHVGITVRDMERMKNFYCDTLGFSVVWAHQGRRPRAGGLEGAIADITMLEGFGMRIELFKYMAPESRDRGELRQCDFGLTHFGFKVKDARAVHAALAPQGVVFFTPPLDIRPGVVAFYMQDPEGNVIEIMENSVD